MDVAKGDQALTGGGAGIVRDPGGDEPPALDQRRANYSGVKKLGCNGPVNLHSDRNSGLAPSLESAAPIGGRSRQKIISFISKKSEADEPITFFFFCSRRIAKGRHENAAGGAKVDADDLPAEHASRFGMPVSDSSLAAGKNKPFGWGRGRDKNETAAPPAAN